MNSDPGLAVGEKRRAAQLCTERAQGEGPEKGRARAEDGRGQRGRARTEEGRGQVGRGYGGGSG